MTRITVLTGGSTAERDVAFAGAAQVVSALRNRGAEVAVVDTVRGLLSPADETRWLTPAVGRTPPTDVELSALRDADLGPAIIDIPALRDADMVFLIVHGKQGEGGGIQALLDLAGIPYTGSDLLGSALAMDKDIAKRLFRGAGIPTADWVLWPAEPSAIAGLGWPLVVKPSREGSTVGLSVVKTGVDLEPAVRLAQRYDDQVILERYVPGREFTVGILGDRALAVGEIIPSHDIFDYECKYTPGMSREIFPAELDARTAARLRELAWAAHRALKLRDFSRIDFRLDADETPYCLEANTLPGMTRTSLFPQSAAAAGTDFGDACQQIVELALRRSAVRNKVGA
jgi:D-alanine-D-alanine ligase